MKIKPQPPNKPCRCSRCCGTGWIGVRDMHGEYDHDLCPECDGVGWLVKDIDYGPDAD